MNDEILRPDDQEEEVNEEAVEITIEADPIPVAVAPVVEARPVPVHVPQDPPEPPPLVEKFVPIGINVDAMTVPGGVVIARDGSLTFVPNATLKKLPVGSYILS